MSNSASPLTSAAVAAPNSSRAVANPSTLDRAFDALKSYGPGSSRAVLVPIDDAVRACLGNAEARRRLERRLAAVLRDNVPALAKEYVCGKLDLIGSPDSVPTLATLLTNPDLAHAARRALEAMPGDAAVKALRDRLPRVGDGLKVGVINSLGIRRDAKSVPALAALLKNPDHQISAAAVSALGNIATIETAKALRKFLPAAPAVIQTEIAHACLACAEGLSNEGKKAEAQALYRLLNSSRQPPHVQRAAEKGLATRQP